MYARRPDPSRPLRVPENYSGHAFSGRDRGNDMPPAARAPQPPYTPPPSDLPPDSYDPAMQAEAIPAEESPAVTSKEERPKADTAPPETRSESARPASLLSALFSPIEEIGKHFPFGHGIGSEELLILAIMLLVLLSGNESGHPDSEALLLLGLLLFAG